MAEALWFNVIALSEEEEVVFAVMACLESEGNDEADCTAADSVESVSQAVRLRAALQIEMSNIEGRNNGGATQEIVILLSLT